jgi:hypothetical protein
MDKFDLRVMGDMFVTLMFVEVIIKPIAIKIGRTKLKWLDDIIKVIPDWLYSNNN